MAINVDFYTFAKKKNSTEQPNVLDKTTYECVLKDSCGVVNPTIQVNLGTNTYPTFNYMYIGTFGRYYFINEWTYYRGLWECTASVDVLASFKAAIGNATKYILRCADSDYYDENIVDEYYPTTSFATTLESTLTNNPWDATGSYVLGIVGNGSGTDRDGHAVNTVKFGAVQYYWFSSDQLKSLLSYLFGSGMIAQVATGSVEAEWVKANYNPMQYIVSSMWIPIAPPATPNMQNIPFTYFSIPVTCHSLTSDYVVMTDHNLTVPAHPQAATRGEYLQIAPYSNYTLKYLPFGIIPIDSTQIGNSATINTEVLLDLITGTGRLDVTTASGKFIANIESQVGVPVQLSQVSRDTLGGFMNTIGSLAGAAVSIAAGDVGGAIANGASAIGTAAKAAIPALTSTGSNGSRISFNALEKPKLVNKTLSIVDENLVDVGRPCCQDLTIGDLSGYIICSDGELAVSCTETEYDTIGNYLTTGFFYE